MPERRGTITDKLSNVIQVIQLGKKTGTLFVERGEGTQREEGSISFIQGNITHASTGQRTSQVALVWLGTWASCRFIFVATSSENAERLTGPLATLPRTPADTGAFKTTPQPSSRISMPPNNLSSTPTQPVATTGNGINEIPYRTRSLQEALILLDRAKLSRAHRHLLLLIDGHRSIAELVRLVGRKPDEVMKLLRDLAQIGVLHV